MTQHRLISIGALDYAFGLVWRVLNEGSERELAKTGRRFSWTSAVTLGKPIRCAGYADRTLATGSLSAAACLSQTLPSNRTCIVMEDMSCFIDPDSYWFVVIQDGVIYPDTDVLVSGIAALRQQLQPFQDKPDLAFFGNACAAVGACEQPTDSICERLADSDVAPEVLRHCRLRRIRRAAPIGRLLAAAGAIALIACAVFWPLQKQQERARNQADNEALVQEATRTLQALRQAALSGPSASNLNDLLRAALHRTPFYAHAWRLGHAACDNSGCHWTWLSETGVLQDLASRLGTNLAALDATQDGHIASTSTAHAPEALRQSTGEAPGERNHIIGLCQHIRAFSAQCTVQAPEPVQFEHSELLDSDLLYSQGQFTVQAPLVASVAVSSWLSEGWIRPEQVRLDFSDMDNPQWTMEGRYVTQ